MAPLRCPATGADASPCLPSTAAQPSAHTGPDGPSGPDGHRCSRRGTSAAGRASTHRRRHAALLAEPRDPIPPDRHRRLCRRQGRWAATTRGRRPRSRRRCQGLVDGSSSGDRGGRDEGGLGRGLATESPPCLLGLGNMGARIILII
jgi:hypothetical protein